MLLKETTEIEAKWRKQLRIIWNAEYPKVIIEDSQEKFDAYIAGLVDAKHTLVFDNDVLKGWYADFDRDDDRWFLLILNEELQGKGYGRILMQEAQKNNERLNGWVIFSDDYPKTNGSMYRCPIPFYEKLDFRVCEDIVFKSEIITTVKIEWRR